jgi:hypothetical protein
LYPGTSAGYFRREYPDLEGPGGAIMRSHELLTGLAKWNGTQRRWTFANGSIIQFCHAKKEEDVYGYHSQQFDLIALDEATQFTRFQYRYLLTRNRATRQGVSPLMLMATNPGGPGHLFFKTEFVDPGPQGVVHPVEVEPGKKEKHLFIQAFLSDNKILEERDPGYRKVLESQAEVIRQQLLDGRWDIFAGQYFGEWNPAIHVIKPFPIPEHWMKYRSIDWGYNDPSAVYWHAMAPEGRFYTYRELYVNQVKASDLAKMIVKLTGNEEIRYTACSPDMWQKRGNDWQSGESIAETMDKEGVFLMRADPSRVPGWQRMREYMGLAPDGLPWWQIFDTCRNAIRTVPALIRDRYKVEDVSDNCEDHAAESIRYFFHSRPSPITTSSFIVGSTFGVRQMVNFDTEESSAYFGDDDEQVEEIPGFYAR